MERRDGGTPTISTRDDAPPGLPMLTGYAALFDTPTAIRSASRSPFIEVIRPGSFLRSLVSDDDVFAYFEHNPQKRLGSRSSGTLRLWEDAVGLRFELRPIDTTASRDALAEIRAGLMRGMSFGFRVPPGGESMRRENGIAYRELTNVQLIEITLTARPAYKQTSVGIAGNSFGRSIDRDRDRRERLLRLVEAA